MKFWEKEINEVNQLIKQYPIILLAGPRQIGKTTFSKQLEYVKYFNLENINDLKLFDNQSTNPETFKGLTIIDEIGQDPNVLSKIKMIVDVNRSAKFIITMASYMSFLDNGTLNIASRVYFYELTGVNQYYINNDTLDKHIFRGRFPSSYFAIDDSTSSTFIENFIIYSVIPSLSKFKFSLSPYLFYNLLKKIAENTGNVISYNQLAIEFNVAINTINNYLEFLESIYLIRIIYQKKANRTPKIYIRDSGILCSLLNIKTQKQLKESEFFARIWEAYIIEYLYSEFKLNKYNTYYYRDKTKEIDLTAEIDGTNYGFEIKHKINKERLVRDFDSLSSELKLEYIFIVNYEGRHEDLTKNLRLFSIFSKTTEKKAVEPPSKKTTKEGKIIPEKKVFISYAHKDSEVVLKIKNLIEKAGINVIIDVETLRFGDSITEFIDKSVRISDYTVQILSKNSLSSQYVMLEFIETHILSHVDNKRYLIPLYIDQSIFDDDFYFSLARSIKQDIEVINKKMIEAIELDISTLIFDSKRERLLNHKNTLGNAFKVLRDSLIGDFTNNEKIEENIDKLIFKIKE